MPFPFTCENCKVIVERDVFNNPTQCYIGNSWDGRKWSWDYCCTCYCKIKRHNIMETCCVYCLKRAGITPSMDDLAKLENKRKDQRAYQRKLKEWKAKGFDHIPHDRTIWCFICQNKFVFTVGEQVFFHGKGFQEPRKCKECRESKKSNTRPYGIHQRNLRTNCANSSTQAFHNSRIISSRKPTPTVCHERLQQGNVPHAKSFCIVS